PWSPDGKTKYELVKRFGGHALAAIRDDKTDILVKHGFAQAVKENFYVLLAFTALEYHVNDYYLSPNGRYLYYFIQACTVDMGPCGSERHMVVDVLSRPARVWEIQAEMTDVRWHPNGRELYFMTPVGKPHGPPMYQSSDTSLAVVQFPP